MITEQTRAFLENAVEAATKIRKTNEIISGNNNIPEEGTLLGDTYYCIADMIKSYLLAIGMKVIEEDQFNNMITIIMFAEKEEINDIVIEYRGNAYVS